MLFVPIKPAQLIDVHRHLIAGVRFRARDIPIIHFLNDEIQVIMPKKTLVGSHRQGQT